MTSPIGGTWDRLRDGWTGVIETIQGFFASSPSYRLSIAGSTIVGLSLFTVGGLEASDLAILTVDYVLGLHSKAYFEARSQLWIGALVAAAMGAGLYLLGWRTRDQHAKHAAVELASGHLRARGFRAPAMLGRDDLATALPQGPPALREVLSVIRTWRPPHRAKETIQAKSLLRALRRRGFKVRDEKKFSRDARADLIVDDVLLIEMKRGSSTATIDRASGQLERYVDAWTQGPIILLVVGGDRPEARERLARLISRLQERSFAFGIWL